MHEVVSFSLEASPLDYIHKLLSFSLEVCPLYHMHELLSFSLEVSPLSLLDISRVNFRVVKSGIVATPMR